MQKRLLFFICSFMIVATAAAQDSTASKEAYVLDTASILQDLQNLLDSSGDASYVMLSAGLSNRLFSLHNKQLNTKQATTAALVYSPSLGYFHKSGFSLSAGVNLLNDKKDGFGPTQFSITPAFDLGGNDNWSAGISYSRYFIRDKYSVYASPVQNDLYGYASYKKYWLEPGIALGYATGNYTEINKFTIQATGNTFIDTGTYKMKSFSMIASVSHDFEWSKVFGNGDAISITPALQLNFSSDSTQGTSHTLGQNLPARFLKRRFARLQGGNSFQAQSVALSVDINYAIGNFTILPQVYLDYYLPKTDEKRFTQTFSIVVGYTF